MVTNFLPKVPLISFYCMDDFDKHTFEVKLLWLYFGRFEKRLGYFWFQHLVTLALTKSSHHRIPNQVSNSVEVPLIVFSLSKEFHYFLFFSRLQLSWLNQFPAFVSYKSWLKCKKILQWVDWFNSSSNWWPDVGIKSCQKLPNVATAVFS